MTPKQEETLLDAVRQRYPEQARSLESFFWAGWEFAGYGADNSIDIKRKNDTGYIRTDGTMRYES